MVDEGDELTAWVVVTVVDVEVTELPTTISSLKIADDGGR